MSSLLEEAIVDAKALKEAALKNAENAVLERYSGEVKKTLDSLLEEEVPLEQPLGEESTEPSEELTDFLNEIPLAHENEALDGPGDTEIIEINFHDLKQRIAADEAKGLETTPEDMTDTFEVASNMMPEPSMGQEAPLATGSPVSPATDEFALTEEMLSDLVEELVVDMTDRPQGWASMNSADNSIEQANNNAMATAQAVHLEEDEEPEDEATTASDVVPETGLLEDKIQEITESNRELRALVLEAKSQLTTLNLDNAKLVYQNKALNSTSLNERQRKQIVEAVQSANSVEEASMIFETIQNAVGPAPDQRTRPQTLREAIQRPTSILLNSKKNNKATEDPRMGRMLRLAGLNK